SGVSNSRPMTTARPTAAQRTQKANWERNSGGIFMDLPSCRRLRPGRIVVNHSGVGWVSPAGGRPVGPLTKYHYSEWERKKASQNHRRRAGPHGNYSLTRPVRILTIVLCP